MKVVFVGAIHPVDEVLEIPLGLLSVATVLRKGGHEVEIVEPSYLNFRREIPASDPDLALDWLADHVLSKRPSLVGLFGVCTRYHNAILLSRRLKRKEPELPILLGGPQATLSAAASLEAFDSIDLIALGESETNILDIVRTFEDASRIEQIPGLAHRSGGKPCVHPPAPLIQNLDDLPELDYSLLPHMRDIPRSAIEAGRGCPYGCRFCSTKTIWKRRFRMKSVDRILSEITRLHATYGVTGFRMIHDHFTFDQEMVGRLCDRIVSGGIPMQWDCSARPDTLDPALIGKLARAGCDIIRYGIETGSRRVQKLINKHMDMDRTWQAIEAAVREGITVKLSFMFGIPGETEDDLAETVAFVEKAVARGVQSIVLRHFAMFVGTELHEVHRKDLVFDETITGDGVLSPEAKELVLENPELLPEYYRLASTPPCEHRHIEYRAGAWHYSPVFAIVG